jgi:rod shape-determining protein MreC
MKSLFEFIIRHHFTALFIVFQVFNLFLIVEFNEYQKQIFFNFSNTVSGSIHSAISSVTGYMNLKEKNKALSEENARLRNKLERIKQINNQVTKLHSFEFLSASIVYSSTSYQNNFLIINKGKNDSINENMGVIGPNGVIGVTFKVSKHYTSVLSILNTKTGIVPSTEISKSRLETFHITALEEYI